jgi:hypothetical protein
MTVTNGLDALDADYQQKTAALRNRPPRPVPPPKYARTDRPEAAQPATNLSVAEPAPSAAVSTSDKEPAAVAPHEPAALPAATPQKPAGASRRSQPSERARAAVEADQGPLRPAQLYLDGTTDDHLRRIKAAALVEGSDVTNSAVVRRAVAELVERYGYEGVVRLIYNDPRTQRGKGRPRR